MLVLLKVFFERFTAINIRFVVIMIEINGETLNADALVNERIALGGSEMRRAERFVGGGSWIA